MQFQVPQFIEVEDRVVGPLTIKQFVYLAGGAGICVVCYVFIKPLFISIFLILPVAVFSLALAFFKINNKPFIQILESAFYFSLREKLYIWKKEEKRIETKKEGVDESLGGLFSPRLSDSKLKDLAWSLDVNERIKKESRA